MAESNSGETVVVLNPNSGNGQHVGDVRERAELRGYALRETAEPGDAVELAREAAASGASTVVAAGGDGTVNEVVRGVDAAAAFESVTVGVIPCGTGNNFAGNVGITGIADAFDVVENGERRRLDLGRTDEHLFVNSCVAGLTAEASGEASVELKRRFGAFAYVITTLRSLTEFESLPLSVDVYEDGRETTAWEGDATMVLVGNGRRFVWGDDTQADVEDGRFEVTVVGDVSMLDMVGLAFVETLFGAESERVTRFRVPALEIAMQNPESVRFSLDGEIVQRQSLSVYTDPKTVEVAVGDSYTPTPAER